MTNKAPFSNQCTGSGQPVVVHALTAEHQARSNMLCQTSPAVRNVICFMDHAICDC